MIDLDEYFLVVRRRPTEMAGKSVGAVFESVVNASHVAAGTPYGPNDPQQPTEWHYDGRHSWLVTYSDKRTFDGQKKLAFVVAYRPIRRPPRHAEPTGLMRGVR